MHDLALKPGPVSYGRRQMLSAPPQDRARRYGTGCLGNTSGRTKGTGEVRLIPLHGLDRKEQTWLRSTGN